jgi:hypothetical protein
VGSGIQWVGISPGLEYHQLSRFPIIVPLFFVLTSMTGLRFADPGQ